MNNKFSKVTDHYFDEDSQKDVRESKEFIEFKNQVLIFIKEKKSVTWRMLNEKFYYNAYWLTMAVELLDGKNITVESQRIPERIVVKEKKNGKR